MVIKVCVCVCAFLGPGSVCCSCMCIYRQARVYEYIDRSPDYICILPERVEERGFFSGRDLCMYFILLSGGRWLG